MKGRIQDPLMLLTALEPAQEIDLEVTLQNCDFIAWL